MLDPKDYRECKCDSACYYYWILCFPFASTDHWVSNGMFCEFISCLDNLSYGVDRSPTMAGRRSQRELVYELVSSTRRTRWGRTERWHNSERVGIRCGRLFRGKWWGWRLNHQDLTILQIVMEGKCGAGAVSATWRTKRRKESCLNSISPRN